MGKHEHGSMDISAQEKTYAGFIKTCVIVSIISALILIFLAIFRT